MTQPETSHDTAPESTGSRLARAWRRNPQCVDCGEAVLPRALFLARLVTIADTGAERVAHGACVEFGKGVRRAAEPTEDMETSP